MQIKSKAIAFLNKLTIKKLLPYFFIVLFGLIICLPLMKSSSIGGHDIVFHTYREPSTVNSLKDGQILPQVDPQALGGFGYSWNMFYGPLSSYVSTIFRIVAPDWFTAINLFIIFSIIASGIFLYRFVAEATNRKLPALFAAVIYMAAPYHLIDIIVRQAQGELLPFVFAPTLFHGLYRILYKDKGFILLGVGFAGILLSHNISALIFALFAALYVLFNIKPFFTKAKLKQLFLGGALSLGLSAFFILPLIELQRTHLYSVFDTSYMTIVMGATDDSMHGNALTISRLLFNPVTVTGGGSFDMPFSLGLITLVAVALIPVGYKRMPKNIKRLTIQMGILALISLVLVTKLIPWNIMPSLFLNIQFPWRFLMPSVLFLSIIAGISLFYAFEKLLDKKNNAYIGFVAVSCLAIYSSGSLLSLATYASVPKIDYDYSLKDSASLRDQWIDQYTPKALYGPSPVYVSPDRYVPLILATIRNQPDTAIVTSGEAIISNFKKQGTKSTFTISTEKESVIELPFVYYPGYKAYIMDGDKKTTLQTKVSDKGFVAVIIPANLSGEVHSKFGLSGASLIGFVITVLTLTSLAAYAYLANRKSRK